MKNWIISLLIFLVSYHAISQTTARLEKQKDAWGTEYTYVGAVKNGKSEGLGMASYVGGTGLYYVGYFANGEFSGKGFLMFSNGEFSSGEWKNGKLNGKGAGLKSGDLYIGEYQNGTKNGKGVLIYKDNGFVAGQFSKDQFEGRNIYISKNADILTDNIYHESKKHGSGYQYELASKKLFEGYWENGQWVNERAASYKSFLKSPGFYAEQTEKQTIMGGIDKATQQLNDTAFYYDKTKHRRFFGRYENGFFSSGIIIEDDSSRFVGDLKNMLASGYGAHYKPGHFYSEGNYVKDYLDGPDCLSLDLKNLSVHYGAASAGNFTGKGFLMNKYQDLYVGDFVNGVFTGKGYMLTVKGNCISGTWKDDFPVTITKMVNGRGQTLSLNPKSFSEAISFLNTQFAEQFETVNGQGEDEPEMDNENDAFESFGTGLYNVPGAVKNYIAEGMDNGNLFVSFYLRTTDADKAFAKYNELCKSVQSATVTLENGRSIKLEGEIKKPQSSNSYNITRFYLPGYDGGEDFHVSVVAKKIEGTYKVFIAFGNGDLTDEWALEN